MFFYTLSCIVCNSFIFYWIILPTIIIFGIKFSIRRSWGELDLTNEVDISGKTVIVTGASDGIGKITAQELAIRGARVILGCRNVKKAQNAVQEIRKETKNGELIIMPLDLSSLASVRTFVAEFISKYGGASNKGLSILINNAGVMNTPGVRKLTVDGLEETFGVNHLAPFLLTNLLLPELERASTQSLNASRIVTVSSTGHQWGQLNFEDLMYEKTPLDDTKFSNMSKLYSNSKLANNLMNLELARRLRDKKVIVNSYALCPGLVKTNIGTESLAEKILPTFLARYVVVPMLQFFVMKDVKEGASTTLYCSLSKYLEHHSGEMYQNCQFWDQSTRLKLSERDATILWQKSAEIVKLY